MDLTEFEAKYLAHLNAQQQTAVRAVDGPVLLLATPGSGKTTCVAPALLGAPFLRGKKIVMLEPRRLAARSCAQFIAGRLGCRVGGTVGYQVRLERKIGPDTRLEILTEGLLTRRLLSDPELSDVGLLVFDEFHERSLQCDTAFAMALDVRRALRDDLRIMVMSATLDTALISDHLGDADIHSTTGRKTRPRQSPPAASARRRDPLCLRRFQIPFPAASQSLWPVMRRIACQRSDLSPP